MISRRDLMKWSALVPALAAGSNTARAAMPHGLDAMLLDERWALRPSEDHPGTPVFRFKGDVTKVWYENLDGRWRTRGFVLGGITGTDALFVLETLANHHGRRVVSRTKLEGPHRAGIAPVGWIIAPHHPSVLA